jgi:ribosomal protein S27AE
MIMEKGRVLCPKCNGKKFLAHTHNKQYSSRLLCHQCAGEGEVWWIDVVFNRFKRNTDTWQIYDRFHNPNTVLCEELVL